MSMLLNERGLPGRTALDRYGFIDNAKAIGMVLIVCGHSKGLPAYLSHFIFSFHVPLFFFISGFLLKSGKLEASIGNNVQKILRTLGVPYVLFFLLAWAYWLATRDIGSKALLYGDQSWYSPVAGLFTGLDADLYVDPPLWFFPSLILTAIVYQVARKWMALAASTGLFVMAGFILSLLWKYGSYRLPLGLDNMWIALSFYALGQYFRERNAFNDVLTGGRQRRGKLVVLLCIALPLLAYAVLLNGKADLGNMLFGIWPVLYLPSALLGIAAVFSVSLLLPPSRISNWISANTLTIFPAHFLCLSLVRGFAVALHVIPDDFNYGLGWNVISSTLAILLCVPLVYFLNRSPVPLVGNAR
ncbi:MAG TPA: acyltransferase family protein [Herbaspirillum sp.]|nr:acyltransferase family protein [Herbaspirillum sp.]